MKHIQDIHYGNEAWSYCDINPKMVWQVWSYHYGKRRLVEECASEEQAKQHVLDSTWKAETLYVMEVNLSNGDEHEVFSAGYDEDTQRYVADN